MEELEAYNQHKSLCVHLYLACIFSTLLYGSESWPSYSKQERRLNSLHLHFLRRILNITWMDKITNFEVLRRTGVQSAYAVLSQRRLRWLGHLHRMDDDRIKKDLLYGKLSLGKRGTGRHRLRFKDACERDLQACSISPSNWESLAADRQCWKQTVTTGTTCSDLRRADEHNSKCCQRKQMPTAASTFICRGCHRDCHSQVGLASHKRKCHS